ncbi:Ribosome-binding factor A [Fundidesulfovibrio magnetotacticus]|uniref:Ribosome-binding factor A n=1 Tax=Fundidesulfovibrio magnetotacticus TaxID=2730080 RepID=A0A6V8LNZ7_9BACT|nr:30S ribosome-binding factor RbfA [Fundidesulfovibrio magnetotacticus]GFK92720.1 Ribosome-binding factor A [Fundidesulfovibrio magnetotacticus]
MPRNNEGPSRRSMRLADQIMRDLASLLAMELADPRLELVTISGVRLNSDLSVATVYYTMHGDAERFKAAESALYQARGLMRSRLAKGLNSKFVPELRFARDEFLETMVYGQPHA